jgi:hypothetical protein
VEGLREHRGDAGIRLVMPDKPVMVFGVEAADLRIEDTGVENEENARRIDVLAAIGLDELDRQAVHRRGGPLDWLTFQKLAMAICSAVRLSATWRTPARAVRNSGLRNAGGIQMPEPPRQSRIRETDPEEALV